jgi:hypothetical protein
VRAYLITTGSLFGLLASVHLWQTITHRSRLLTDPGFLLEGPGIGLVAGAIVFWAWRLLRHSARTA